MNMRFQYFPMHFPNQGTCVLHTAITEEGYVVGAVTTLEKNPLVLEFCRLFVEPDIRRKGIARNLIKHMEEHARAYKYRALSCLVEPGNSVARSFYETLGFTPAFVFGDGDIIYTKPITEARK